MDIVSEWGGRVGVSVSENKTVMMLMKGTLSSTRHPSVKVNRKCVKYERYVKYLGVWVGERMSFKPHLGYLRNKCVNVVGKLRRVMKSGACGGGLCVYSTRGFSPRALCVWYGSMRYGYARDMMSESGCECVFECV